jgi:hypothetical protein
LSDNNPNNPHYDRQNRIEDKLWEWQLHEDELLSNRANFMLVAESMFFTAFAALAINSKSLLPIVLGISGLLLNVIWIKMTTIQLNHTTLYLRQGINELAEKDKTSFMSKYVSISSKRPLPTITEFLRIWIPLLFVGAWLFLLAFYSLHALGLIAI